MTVLLQEAVCEIKLLPDKEQNAMAALILEELASERRWDESFRRSQDQLAKLGDKALAEFRTGKTEELDLDTL